jgi:hypothetical protein
MPASIESVAKDLAAIWGAILSTILAIQKGYEWWASRFRLETDYEFTDDPSIGHKITIRNLTGRPITIPFREVLSRKRWHFFRKPEEIPFTDESPTDVVIPAYGSHAFEFMELSHFSLKSKHLADHNIYLKVWIAGRKPKTLHVYANRA